MCIYIYIHIYNHSFNNRRSLSLGHNCQAYASGVPLATPLEDVDRLEASGVYGGASGKGFGGLGFGGGGGGGFKLLWGLRALAFAG